MARLVRAGDEGEKVREVMAEMDDVLAEFRHRIMGPIESGPLVAFIERRTAELKGRDGGVAPRPAENVAVRATPALQDDQPHSLASRCGR
jgi:hypothetical protein